MAAQGRRSTADQGPVEVDGSHSDDQRELLDEVLRLPGSARAAMEVLRSLDDPDSSAEQIGERLRADQALSTRAVFIANSSFYGRAVTVAGPGEAAAVIGFDTVRSLAAGVAFGLFDTAGSLPRSYFRHTAAAAAAASVLAPRADVPVGDAFSLGMLHDLGSALLAVRRPAEALTCRLEAAEQGIPLDQAELAHFGIHHGTLGALALRATRFPATYVHAVLTHHRPIDDETTRLGLVCKVADAMAHRLDDRWPGDDDELDEATAALGIDAADIGGLLDAARAALPVASAVAG